MEELEKILEKLFDEDEDEMWFPLPFPSPLEATCCKYSYVGY